MPLLFIVTNHEIIPTFRMEVKAKEFRLIFELLIVGIQFLAKTKKDIISTEYMSILQINCQLYIYRLTHIFLSNPKQ